MELKEFLSILFGPTDCADVVTHRHAEITAGISAFSVRIFGPLPRSQPVVPSASRSLQRYCQTIVYNRPIRCFHHTFSCSVAGGNPNDLEFDFLWHSRVLPHAVADDEHLVRVRPFDWNGCVSPFLVVVVVSFVCI